MTIRAYIAGPAAGHMTGAIAAAHDWLAAWRLPLIGAVAAAQALVLGYMVWDRESLLATGRQISLDVRPVDPRSLFRGDYVILSYDISRIPAAMFPAATRIAERYAVRLRHQDGAWKVVGVTRSLPHLETENEIVLAGHVRYLPEKRDAESHVLMSYGIESFFVPEGAGRDIETAIGPGRVRADLSVATSGEAAIKALVVDGQRIEAEPLF